MQIITREEVLAMGLSQSAIRRRVKSGKWQELCPRVYLTSSHPPSWEQRIIGACKWAGPAAVASYRTAGRLWKFPDCDQSLIEVTTTRDLRPVQEDLIVHRASSLQKREKTRIGSIPVTTPVRTVLDLAGVFRERQLIAVVQVGARRDLSPIPRLLRAISEASPGRRGTAQLLRIIEEGIDSYLERLLKALLDKSPHRDYIPQYEVHDSKGKPLHIDFAYPDALVAIEADGWAFHSDHVAFQRDRERWRELGLLGWIVLCFTYEDVVLRPNEVLTTIGRALANGRAQRAVRVL